MFDSFLKQCFLSCINKYTSLALSLPHLPPWWAEAMLIQCSVIWHTLVSSGLPSQVVFGRPVDKTKFQQTSFLTPTLSYKPSSYSKNVYIRLYGVGFWQICPIRFKHIHQVSRIAFLAKMLYIFYQKISKPCPTSLPKHFLYISAIYLWFLWLWLPALPRIDPFVIMLFCTETCKLQNVMKHLFLWLWLPVLFKLARFI